MKRFAKQPRACAGYFRLLFDLSFQAVPPFRIGTSRDEGTRDGTGEVCCHRGSSELPFGFGSIRLTKTTNESRGLLHRQYRDNRNGGRVPHMYGKRCSGCSMKDTRASLPAEAPPHGEWRLLGTTLSTHLPR
jgi:hypothetical protein